MSGRLCIFGEVLFDHFPDGQRVLGGAPFNVAWHLQAFGQRPYFISRVGDDAEGETVRAAMGDWGMDTAGLQTDPSHATGRVGVAFVDGEPHYDIVEPVAYDLIEHDQTASPRCRLLYHGSLALRDPVSRDTAKRLREGCPEIVFVDVNLRRPWWQRAQVLDMVRGADWVKLNSDELALLHDDVDDPAGFLAHHGLSGLVLTRGGEGAEVLTADGEHQRARPQADIPLVDTVGAGDAFASVIILGLALGWPLAVTLPRAQAFASAVVGQRGATAANPDFYRPFIADWQLNV